MITPPRQESALWTHLWRLDKGRRPLGLLRYPAEQLTDAEYWESVGLLWAEAEFPSRQIRVWTQLLTAARPEQQHIMSDGDLELFRALPEQLHVFRGCSRIRTDAGLSYTLDREKAQWFADRFPHLQGTVRERTIAKNDVIACFEYEREVLIHPSKRRLVAAGLASAKVLTPSSDGS